MRVFKQGEKVRVKVAPFNSEAYMPERLFGRVGRVHNAVITFTNKYGNFLKEAAINIVDNDGTVHCYWLKDFIVIEDNIDPAIS